MGKKKNKTKKNQLNNYFVKFTKCNYLSKTCVF